MAFGVFDTGFGIAFFLGSATMGILYAKSLLALVIFSIILQIASLPLFITAINKQPIKDVHGLLNQVAQLGPGSDVSATVLRKGKEFDLNIQIGKRPKPKTTN